MINLREPTKAEPCACCGAASEATVWDLRVCCRCYGFWVRDERFSSGVINKHLGLSDSPEEFTEAGHARYCAEAKKRTAAWVLERRATARAA